LTLFASRGQRVPQRAAAPLRCSRDPARTAYGIQPHRLTMASDVLFRPFDNEQKVWRDDMKQLIKACKNLGSYLKAVVLRRKRRKKEKEEDPYIYPIF
jgi:hypothetical protein